MRRFLTLLVLVPLAVIVVFFSVANRQLVTVSLDPFHDGTPALSFAAPLFVLMFGALVLGLLLGGIAAWTRQGRWRRAARRAEREAEQLRADASAAARARAASNGAAALPPARDAA